MATLTPAPTRDAAAAKGSILAPMFATWLPRGLRTRSGPPRRDAAHPIPTLAATRHGDKSSRATVVLLHGMLTSSRYWDPVVQQLIRSDGVLVVTVDLLGFGQSPKPRQARYDYRDHVEAVAAAIEALDVQLPVTVVAHSMGALIGLRLAATRPDLVGRLMLIGMPVYRSPSTAREAIIGNSAVRRLMLYGNLSRLFCTVWCQALKPISGRLARLYIRRLPAAAAAASVQHSWRSYSQSLHNIVEDQDVARDLDALRCPAVLINGDQDSPTLTAESLPDWRESNPIEFLRVPGGHQLPNEQSRLVAERIMAFSQRDSR